VRLDPTPAAYYDGLALALAAAGNWPHAIRAVSDGLARTEDPRVRYSLLAFRGYAFCALRRWSDAITDLEAARRIRSEAWLLALLGRARFATGDYAEAVIPLRQVLRVAPEDRVVLRLLAESFLRLAAAEPDAARKRLDYLQSRTYSQRLATLTPNDLAAMHLVGRAALGAGSLSEAESVFRQVLSINPRHCYALANLGRTFMAAARLAEAEAYLHNAATCAPRLAAVWESLGEVYLALGKPQDAADAFRRVEEIEPSQAASEFPSTIPAFQPR
jgi:tetratricopeptide (TPR) repeat protein